ncbi:lipid II:glycine glycyltransferase FemX [Williamsia deligens]|uniref:Lipid II:glycine glycyltransferase FemX n=1 Tax=Williamsia deligens TaxID=321325 RepID=A0ABW3G8K7_9NOCA|nr:peptidoglycan bridge formation glycyltransferase FemA/FemB family protein [Williamsia deligens]MCP2194020.1 FemAB family protein [Williamsia deligens]
MSLTLRRPSDNQLPDADRRPPRVRFATPDEVARWDSLILENPDAGTVYRSSANIDTMVMQAGVTPIRLIVDGQAVTGFAVDRPPLGSFWVVFGPPVTTVTELLDAFDALRRFAAEHGQIAVRVRPQLRFDPADAERLRRAGLVRVPAWLEDHTVIVDLTGSESDVMARFKKRARKSIRRALREGVTVTRAEATVGNCELLFDLLSATSGGRFAIPDRATSVAVFRRYAATGDGQLFFAHHHGAVVVGAFVATFGREALYLGAGSVRERDDDPTVCGLGSSRAAYALQWEIMRWAREMGCERYDLDGTPSSQTMHDPDHPRHGVGQFKSAFATDVVDYLGAYQIPVDPARASLLCWVERTVTRANQSAVANRFRRQPVRPNPDHVWLARRGPHAH